MQKNHDMIGETGFKLSNHFFAYRSILIITALVFSLLFSLYSILKAYTLNAYAWDLGLYSQAFYSAIHGQLFYTNLLGESYFAEHFSPFLYVLIIPFYIYPSPYTLLVIQSLAISFSIIPLYYLSKKVHETVAARYGSKYKYAGIISLIIAIAFILSPLTESPVYFDFHLMVFIPLFYFSALYFFFIQKTWLNYLFLILIISLHSSFVFISSATLIMEIFLSHSFFNKSKNELKKLVAVDAVAISAFILYYIAAGILKTYIAGGNLFHSVFSQGQEPTSKSIYGIIDLILYHQGTLLSLLESNYEIKILFLVLAFMAVDFIFYEYPAGLIPAIPYIAYAMLSSYIPYYFLGFQYSMMFIPAVFVSGILGISILIVKSGAGNKKAKHARKNLRNVLVAIVAFAVAAFIIVSPVSPLTVMPNGIHTIVNDKNSQNAGEISFIYDVRSDINMNESLVTGNSLFPVFYKDMNATAFPYASINQKVPFYEYLIVNVNDSQSYINDSNNMSLIDLAHSYLTSNDYGIIAEGYNILVLERNYTSFPLIFNPSSVHYNKGNFAEINNEISGPFINSNLTYLQKLQMSGEDHYSGNKTFMLPGEYNITIKTGDYTGIKNIVLNITALNGTSVIFNNTLAVNNGYINFNLSIKNIECYVLFKIYSGDGSFNVKYMNINQINS